MKPQPHGGPKARHAHRRVARWTPEPKRALLPHRPVIVCEGGALGGLSVRVSPELLDGPLLIGRGRYTYDRTSDTWIWEDDHA